MQRLQRHTLASFDALKDWMICIPQAGTMREKYMIPPRQILQSLRTLKTSRIGMWRPVVEFSCSARSLDLTQTRSSSRSHFAFSGKSLMMKESKATRQLRVPSRMKIQHQAQQPLRSSISPMAAAGKPLKNPTSRMELKNMVLLDGQLIESCLVTRQKTVSLFSLFGRRKRFVCKHTAGSCRLQTVDYVFLHSKSVPDQTMAASSCLVRGGMLTLIGPTQGLTIRSRQQC